MTSCFSSDKCCGYKPLPTAEGASRPTLDSGEGDDDRGDDGDEGASAQSFCACCRRRSAIGGGAPQAKPVLPDVGDEDFDRWRQELIGMKVEGIDEALLHVVQWSEVVKNLALHVPAMMLLAVIVFFVGMRPERLVVAPLPFAAAFLLGVVLFEVVVPPKHRLVDALRGHLTVQLTRGLHLYMVAKSIRVVKVAVPLGDFKQGDVVRGRWGLPPKWHLAEIAPARMPGAEVRGPCGTCGAAVDTEGKLNLKWAQTGDFDELDKKDVARADVVQYLVRDIMIDDPDIPDRSLRIGTAEVRPNLYELVRLRSSEGADILRPLSLKQEHVLDTSSGLRKWLREHPEGHGEPVGEKKIQEWMQTLVKEMEAVVDGTRPAAATFARTRYFEGLSEHWAIRVAFAVSMVFYLALPSVSFLYSINGLWHVYCKAGGVPRSPKMSVEGEPLCGPAAEHTCEEVCGNLLSFIQITQRQLHICQIEPWFGLALVAVVLFSHAVNMAEISHVEMEAAYLRSLRMSRSYLEQVRAAKLALEHRLSTGFVFDMWWTRLRRITTGLTESARSAGPLTRQMVQDEAYSQQRGPQGAPRLNGTLAEILHPLESLMSGTTLKCGPLPSRPDPLRSSEASLAKTAAGTWADWAREFELWERDFKVSVDIQISCKETWEQLYGVLLKQYDAQLSRLVQGPPGVVDGQTNPPARVHFEQDIRLGPQTIPKGFVLTHFFATLATSLDPAGELVVRTVDELPEDWQAALKLEPYSQTLLVRQDYEALTREDLLREGADIVKVHYVSPNFFNQLDVTDRIRELCARAPSESNLIDSWGYNRVLQEEPSAEACVTKAFIGEWELSFSSGLQLVMYIDKDATVKIMSPPLTPASEQMRFDGQLSVLTDEMLQDLETLASASARRGADRPETGALWAMLSEEVPDKAVGDFRVACPGGPDAQKCPYFIVVSADEDGEDLQAAALVKYDPRTARHSVDFLAGTAYRTEELRVYTRVPRFALFQGPANSGAPCGVLQGAFGQKMTLREARRKGQAEPTCEGFTFRSRGSEVGDGDEVEVFFKSDFLLDSAPIRPSCEQDVALLTGAIVATTFVFTGGDPALEPEVTKCPAGHTLEPALTSIDGMLCDLCWEVAGDVPKGTWMASCRDCDYDVCGKCARKPPVVRRLRVGPGGFVFKVGPKGKMYKLGGQGANGEYSRREAVTKLGQAAASPAGPVRVSEGLLVATTGRRLPATVADRDVDCVLLEERAEPDAQEWLLVRDKEDEGVDDFLEELPFYAFIDREPEVWTPSTRQGRQMTVEQAAEKVQSTPGLEGFTVFADTARLRYGSTYEVVFRPKLHAPGQAGTLGPPLDLLGGAWVACRKVQAGTLELFSPRCTTRLLPARLVAAHRLFGGKYALRPEGADTGATGAGGDKEEDTGVMRLTSDGLQWQRNEQEWRLYATDEFGYFEVERPCDDFPDKRSVRFREGTTIAAAGDKKQWVQVEQLCDDEALDLVDDLESSPTLTSFYARFQLSEHYFANVLKKELRLPKDVGLEAFVRERLSTDGLYRPNLPGEQHWAPAWHLSWAKSDGGAAPASCAGAKPDFPFQVLSAWWEEPPAAGSAGQGQSRASERRPQQPDAELARAAQGRGRSRSSLSPQGLLGGDGAREKERGHLVFLRPPNSDEYELRPSSVLGVVMGDSNIASDGTSKFWSLSKVVLAILLLLLEVVGFPLIMPMWRLYKGRRLFPAPFAAQLVCGVVSQSVALWYFLYMFHTVSQRLSIIGQLLHRFEQKTLDPNVKLKQAKDPKAKKKASGGAADDAGGGGGGEESAKEKRPFDLYISATEQGFPPYDPKDARWNEQFKEKCQNVENWTHSAEYLRVFASSARLTAQASLMAAASIVALFFVLSLVQAWQGQGMISVNRQAIAENFAHDVSSKMHDVAEAGKGMLNQLKGDASKALSGLQERAKGMAKDLKDSVQDRVEDAVDRATDLVVSEEGEDSEEARRLARRLAASAGEEEEADDAHLDAAVRSLRAALATGPWLQAIHGPLLEQLRVMAGEPDDDPKGRRLEEVATFKHLEEDYLRNVKLGDLSRITATQVLTLIVIVLLSLQAGTLIYNIAHVNDHFDRHVGLLTEQKKKHRSLQRKREQEYEESKTWEGPAGQASDPPAEAAAEKASKVAVRPQDTFLQLYEKELDMAIESTHNNKARFPFTLFGHVITTGVLATWMLLAFSQVAARLKTMMPPLAYQACQWLEHSQFVMAADQAINRTAAAATLSISQHLQEARNKAESTLEGLDQQARSASKDLGVEALFEAGAGAEGSRLRGGGGGGKGAAAGPGGGPEARKPEAGGKPAGTAGGRSAAAAEAEAGAEAVRSPGSEHAILKETGMELLGDLTTELDLGLDKAQLGNMHLSLADLIESGVCKPLRDSLTSGITGLQTTVRKKIQALDQEGASGETSGGRRLHAQLRDVGGRCRRGSCMPSVEPALAAWWEAQPGEPVHKLAAARVVLQDLLRRAHQLLVRAPAAVVHAHRDHGMLAAADLALFHVSEGDHAIRAEHLEL